MDRRFFLTTTTAATLAYLPSRAQPAPAGANSTDWPHWRGPQRNDIVSQPSGYTGGAWPLEKLWQRQIGVGSTSPLVVGNRLYTLGYHGKGDTAYCLDLATGKTLWSEQYVAPRFGRNAEGDQGLYAGPTSTPEYDLANDTLYTLSCDGDLLAWQAADGKRLWSKNLYDAYHMQKRPKVGRSGRRDYGYTTAPLVHGDTLLVEAGGEQGTLVALDKRTGEHLWGSQAQEFAGHTGGIVPLAVEGVPCAALLSFAKLLVIRLDAQAGATVAEYPWLTEFGNNIASPGVLGNSLVLTSGYNVARTVRLDISLGGAKEVWQSDRYSKICTPVIAHNRVYFTWTKFVCLDFATGKLVWEGGQTGDAGSLILTGDDRLIAQVGRGQLHLVECALRSPEQLQVLASPPQLFRSDAWPHVVLAGEHLVCKGKDGELVCLKTGG